MSLPEIAWSAWLHLRDAWLGTAIPAQPGLYRIRRVGQGGLDYIGQTGSGTMTLRKRLAMLRGIFALDMPYRDPHTAAPALWALRALEGCDFEVSVAPVEGSTAHRKGLEAVAIALFRQERQCSPTACFGRMPLGFVMSSANNERLAAAGKVRRGGRCTDRDESHHPGLAPLGPLQGSPIAHDWCGHRWTDWTSIDSTARLPRNALGLYRIRSTGKARLLYVGEGLLRARLAAHARRASIPDHPQGRAFACAAGLECSWVDNSAWLRHHRLEMENDLIAAHVLSLGVIPAAQFIG